MRKGVGYSWVGGAEEKDVGEQKDYAVGLCFERETGGMLSVGC